MRFEFMAAPAYLTDHERLDVWQRAMELMVESYRVARRLPVEERYGLASQIRRAAVSIPANIAEGCGRHSKGDRLRFLAIAYASLCELRTLLRACEMLEYLGATEVQRARDLANDCARLLGGLRRYLRQRQA